MIIGFPAYNPPVTTDTLASELAREPSWAVVGASAAPHKFGNRIFRALRESGYRVWGVNPRRPIVDGVATFASLSELPEVPTVVNFVIPPEATLAVVREAAELGVRAVWFQPGAESPEAIATARELGLEVVEDCILVRRVRNPG